VEVVNECTLQEKGDIVEVVNECTLQEKGDIVMKRLQAGVNVTKGVTQRR
jgi:hypothetical protein